MDPVRIGKLSVSRFLLGGNPFSGFSHQSVGRDREMVRYYTVARIKQTLFEAERLGITGIVSRTDNHIIRLLLEYRDEGGTLQWLAQTCPGVGPTENCVRAAAAWGAAACHNTAGSWTTSWPRTRSTKPGASVDPHPPERHARWRPPATIPASSNGPKNTSTWTTTMCCYYNPTPRDDNPEHVHGAEEKYLEEGPPGHGDAHPRPPEACDPL